MIALVWAAVGLTAFIVGLWAAARQPTPPRQPGEPTDLQLLAMIAHLSAVDPAAAEQLLRPPPQGA